LVALILLLLLTVLALSSARTAILQQRMAGNLQQQTQAFQAAESGIAAILFRLRSSDLNQWPVDGEKSLCGTPAALPDWNSSCPSQSNNAPYYDASVKRLVCTNDSAEICFNIISTGIYETGIATHIQGYAFSIADLGNTTE